MAPSMDQLQFIVVGSKKSGKSSACNILLQKNLFYNTVTTEHIQTVQAIVGGRRGLVSDTPGWDSNCSPDDLLKTLQKACQSAHQSPVVLLTVPIIQNPKILQQRVKTLLNVVQCFDNEIWSRTMILFTKADRLDPSGIEGYLRHNEETMQKLLKLCGYRYQIFSIYQGQQQVRELLQKVDRMLEGKRGSTLQVAVSNKLNQYDLVSEEKQWRRKERDPGSEEQEDVGKDEEYELSQNQETEQHVQCPETDSSYHTVRQKMKMEDIHKAEAGANKCVSESTDETYSSKPDTGDNQDENQSNIKPTRDPERKYNITDCRWRVTQPAYSKTHKQVEQNDLLQVSQNKELHILKNQSVDATANFSSINVCRHDAVRIQVLVCGGIWNPLAQPKCIWFLICFDKADLVLFLVLNLSVFFYFTGKNPEEPPASKQEDDQSTNPSHPVGSETREESDRINTDGQELVKVASSDAPEDLQSGLDECSVTAVEDENSKSTETGSDLKIPEETMTAGHEEIPKNNKNQKDEPDGGDGRVETNDMTLNTKIKKTPRGRKRRRVRAVAEQSSEKDELQNRSSKEAFCSPEETEHCDLKKKKKKKRGRKHADGSAVEEPISRARQGGRSTDADLKPIRAGENHRRSSDHRQTRRGRRPERLVVPSGDQKSDQASDVTEVKFGGCGTLRRSRSMDLVNKFTCDQKSDQASDETEVKFGGSWKLRRSRSMDRDIKFTSTRDSIQLEIDRDRQKTEHTPDFSC